MDLFDQTPKDRIRSYRELAKQAVDDAIYLRNAELRQHFLLIASNWRRLADELEETEARRSSFKLRDPFTKGR